MCGKSTKLKEKNVESCVYQNDVKKNNKFKVPVTAMNLGYESHCFVLIVMPLFIVCVNVCA